MPGCYYVLVVREEVNMIGLTVAFVYFTALIDREARLLLRAMSYFEGGII